MARTAAEVIVETLVQSGVKRVYGLPGDSLNGITESTRTNSLIEWILTVPRTSRKDNLGARQQRSVAS